MRAGWRTGQLGDFFEVVTGGTPSKAKKEMYGNYMPLVKPPELTGAGVQSSEDFLSKAGAAASRILPVGSVLVSCIGNLGKVGISKIELATNQQINAIKPNAEKALPEFVFYLVQAPYFSDQLRKLASGTTVPIVNKSKFKNILVALPPLAEQKRIVAILDEAFAGIDTAIANTEKNLANARELFESYLNSVFSQRGEGWVKKPLGECFRLRSGDGLTSKQMRPGEFPVFGGNGIAGRHDQSNLSGSNVIIGRVGALCGNARHINEAIWLTDNAFKVVEKRYSIDDQFLVYLLNAHNLRRYARQAAQPVISNSSLKEIDLNFPESESQQRQIVEQLDELEKEIRRIESVYQQKLTSLAELKQSLLQKAFSGELTADKVVSNSAMKEENVA
jgi:type I restriction enzyme S subunit